MPNERIKLLADLKVVVAKHGCCLPAEAALIILNHPDNMKVFKTNEYVRIPWDYVDQLIQDRKALH
jgi:hypothetical protein